MNIIFYDWVITQMVGAEGELEAVPSFALGRPHHTSVVDQDIQTRLLCKQPIKTDWLIP